MYFWRVSWCLKMSASCGSVIPSVAGGGWLSGGRRRGGGRGRSRGRCRRGRFVPLGLGRGALAGAGAADAHQEQEETGEGERQEPRARKCAGSVHGGFLAGRRR